MSLSRTSLLALTVAAIAVLTACAGSPETSPSTVTIGATGTPGATATASATPTSDFTLESFPIGTTESTTALPSDLPQGCRDILNDEVLAQLDGVPLNADGMGGGIRADSARVCVWGDPDAVATRLVTVIGYSPDQEARDELYRLAGEGYTCYEPNKGIRCEKTWDHPTLPVTQGRTLFYRDGVIVDTQYSNLAPSGYTDAIIDALW
ncbi:MAG: hypothetical protein QM622_09135 [Microbacterium sp.]